MLVFVCVFFALVFVIFGCNEPDIMVGDNYEELVASNTRSAGVHQHYFFTGDGNRVYLSLNTNYAFLSIREPRLPAEFAQRSLNIRASEFQAERRTDVGRFHAESRYYTTLRFEETLSEEQYFELLADIRRENEGVIISPFFTSEHGERIGLSNLFYVKLITESDTTLLQNVADQYKLTIIEQDPFMPLWFTLSTTELTRYNTLELYHIFIRERLFQAALPDFMVDVRACVADPLFDQQWGLSNLGQSGGTFGFDIRVCDAWQISTGAGVTVAIIDEGILWDHPDLQGNIHPSAFDTESRIGPVHPSTLLPVGCHGTPVAGIVGALQNNFNAGGINEGISGVAPNSQLMSISRCLKDVRTGMASDLAWGINQAWYHGADVINNSWGHRDLNVADPITRANLISDAIQRAVTEGRGGLGTVVVGISQNQNSAVVFPGTMDEVLTVGAIDRNGHRALFPCPNNQFNGSNFGVGLDVVAPGGYKSIITTYWQGGYFGFGATSAAAPHVAGVAALILSIRPDLTQAQVRSIIKSTANKNLPGWTTHKTLPNGSWNHFVGHGLVDAYAAVRFALGTHFSVSGPTTVCPGVTNAIFTIQGVPSGATINWIAESPLTVVSSNHSTTTVAHTGTATQIHSKVRAEIRINGQMIHTLQHEIVVNRPSVFSIVSTFPSAIQAGMSNYFTADHNGTSLSWSVFPSNGVNIIPACPTWGANVRNITFIYPGNYTISVISTNVCGNGNAKFLDITVAGNNTPLPICPVCGLLACICFQHFGEEEELEEEEIFEII